MKDAKLKSIFAMCLMLLIVATTVVAYERIFREFPSNEWVIDSGNSVDFNFMVNTTSETISYCAIYVNNSGEYLLKANYTDVINATSHISGIAINDSNNRGFAWDWNVTCNNGSTDFNTTVPLPFGVDANPPSVTLDSPVNNYYSPTIDFNLLYTPTDPSNTELASIYTNISTVWAPNQTNNTFTSGVQIFMNTSGAVEGGVYGWNVHVNDSANNSAWGETAGNRTFTVDTLAPSAFNITTPKNATVTNDSTPYVSWNSSNDNNFEKYRIELSNQSDLGVIVHTKDITSASSNETNISNIEFDGQYFIQLVAYDLAGNRVNASQANFTLDREDPIVNLVAPLNGSYASNNSPQINLTVTDNNPDTCNLLLAAPDEGYSINATETNIFNGTKFNLSVSTILPDGVYQYNLECNDTRGARANGSSTNYTLTVDTTPPTAPDLLSFWHMTNNTDKTPVLEWITTTETNFDIYITRAYYSLNNSVAFELNVTARETNFTNMSLVADNKYFFNVTAVDLAGNTGKSINQSNASVYYLDSVCGTLEEGWNLCGAVWTTARNLSIIGAETGANMVSVWNQSHQWATCNYAAAENGQHCAVEVNIDSVMSNTSADAIHNPSVNHAVWVYVNESKEWRNRTWVATRADANITLFNTTNGWNLEAGFVRNGRTFGHLGAISQYGRNNVSMMSLRYNNGTSVPYVNMDLFAGINNLTNIDYGRGYWIFYNATDISGLTGNHTWNSSIGGW